MIRLFIEAADGVAVIRLNERQLTALGAQVGDVVIVERSALKVQPSKAETERQIDVAMQIMEDHRGVLEALAKT